MHRVVAKPAGNMLRLKCTAEGTYQVYPLKMFNKYSFQHYITINTWTRVWQSEIINILYHLFRAGNPTPNVTWYKDGQTPVQRIMGTVRYSQWGIVLEDLVKGDSGNYTCKVCNKNGCIDFTYKVDVVGKQLWTLCDIIKIIQLILYENLKTNFMNTALKK